MSFTDILAAADIAGAVGAFAAAGSFDHKAFFVKVGLTGKPDAAIEKAFNILDQDNSGFIEADELKLFLQAFVPGARVLTDGETKAFMEAGDTDGDGAIGVAEFLAVVKS